MLRYDSDLTTLPELKVYLGIDADNEQRDDQLIGLINRYSGMASAYCSRRFARTTYSAELYDGTGTESLWLNAWPITTPFATSTDDTGATVTHAIYEDSRRKFGSGTLLVEDLPSSAASGDYYVEPGEESQGRVVKIGGTWTRGRGTIRVSYQAGHAPGAIPPPVVEAVNRLCGRAWQIAERRAHATTSESVPGGGSIGSIEHALPNDVKSMLGPFRKIRFWG